MRTVVLLVALGAWHLGCGDEGSDPVVEDAAIDTALDVGEIDPPEVDSGDSDAEGADADAEDTAEPLELIECGESVLNPIQIGSGFFYNCVTTGEQLTTQEVRGVAASAIAIKTFAALAPPMRLGRTLATRGDFLYWDSFEVAGGAVVGRAIHRAQTQPGASGSEVFLAWGPEESAEENPTHYAADTRVMHFALQPEGDHVALQLVSSADDIGDGLLYVYEGQTRTWVSPEACQAFAWSPSGDKLAWVYGGNLELVEPDGSGKVSVDGAGALFKTGVAPAFLSDAEIVYASSKKGLRRWTPSGGKVDVPAVLSEEIQWIGALDGERALVLAGAVLVVDVESGEVTDLGAVPGFGLLARQPVQELRVPAVHAGRWSWTAHRDHLRGQRLRLDGRRLAVRSSGGVRRKPPVDRGPGALHALDGARHDAP
jgi:hypothetical protein